MSLTRAERQRAAAYLQGKYARRGTDIPAEKYDQIESVASGISLPLWGRPARPEQVEWLWDQGMREPSQVHQAFSALPHPHAPGVTVGEFPDYAHALSIYRDHSK